MRSVLNRPQQHGLNATAVDEETLRLRQQVHSARSYGKTKLQKAERRHAAQMVRVLAAHRSQLGLIAQMVGEGVEPQRIRDEIIQMLKALE